MKALLSVATGGPETLVVGDLPEPTAGPDQIVIAVAAAGVNFPDTLIIEDRYQTKPPRPFAPGGEIAGTVVAIGESVSGWKIGDRAMAFTGSGGMAERVAVSADQAFALPEGQDFVPAAALLFTYGTVIHALVDRGRLQPGESLLVLGAAGGIGLATIEIGKAMGAHVVAAVSDEAKADTARQAGADAVIVYPRGPFDKDGARALSVQFKDAVGPNGADVILDPVGGAYAEAALRAIAWEGRFLVVGFPAGIPAIPLNLPLLKSCDIRGVAWGAWALREPAANAAHVAQLVRWWQEGRIAPRVAETFPLERGAEAIRRLAERGAIGKLVVTIGG